MNEDIALITKHVEVLADKGDADHIARYLQKQGIKGRRVNPWKCPISTYLEQQMSFQFSTLPESTGAFNGTERVQLPKNVRDFVRRFDDNAYPKLVG